jgi:hypothetical protein
MEFRNVTGTFRIVIAAACTALSIQGSPAQKETAATALQTAALVSFRGCNSDGQVGPISAPEGKAVRIPLDRKAAGQLAYYKAAQEFGVLAPRGWHCFGVYGSGGSALFVMPEAISPSDLFSGKRELSGPVIQLNFRNGDTSGRDTVAEVIARVFPAYRAFAIEVAEMFDRPLSSLPSGPYQTDKLIYKSSNVVEYTTPAETEGLGTLSSLKKDKLPTRGVAILTGQPPNLVFLAVRLPPRFRELIPAIIVTIEHEVAAIGNSATADR